MITNECHHREQCRAFLDERSGALRLCLDHYITHLLARIGALESTKEAHLARIVELNRMIYQLQGNEPPAQAR